MAKSFLGIGLVVLTAICPAVCQSASKSLPDAPLPQIAAQAEKWSGFDSAASIVRERNASLVKLFDLPTSDQIQEENNRVRRLFYPAGGKRLAIGSASNDDGLLGRATRAASQTILMRDQSGRSRLNTAYLLRTLTSVAADSAAKPYWRRSPTDPAGDFGSSVGSDAGTNLWHEFGPGIEHAMKNYAPKFLSRIEEQIQHSPQSRDARNLSQNSH